MEEPSHSPFPRTTRHQCSPDALALLLSAGSHKRTRSLGPSLAQALCAARPRPSAARLQGPRGRRKLLLVTLPRVRADESSQTGAGRKVGLAGKKLSRPKDRTPSRQPRLGFITRFLPNKGPARPGSSRCCSIEISRWFPINHSLWCLGGRKESNKTSFLRRKSVAEA